MTKPIFFTCAWLIEDDDLVNITTVAELADHVRETFPDAKQTWTLRNPIMNNPERSDVLDLFGSYVENYGDEIGLSESFAARVFDRSDFAPYQTDSISRITNLFGIAPRSGAAYSWSAWQLEWLKSQGIDIVMGQSWSQMYVDHWSGDGAPNYPYWASKRHSLAPAQDSNDNTGLLLLDTNTPDLIANKWPGVRFSIHPADPYNFGHWNAAKITDQYMNCIEYNDFILFVMFPEVRWFNDPSVAKTDGVNALKVNFKNYITWLGQNYPSVQFVTLSEFHDWFAVKYPNNDNIKYKFKFKGSGNSMEDKYGVMRYSDPDTTAYWYFDKLGRVGVFKNELSNEYTLIDCLRYNGNLSEPNGKTENFNIKSGLNWKFDNHKQGYALASIGMTQRWDRAWVDLPPITPEKRSRFIR